MESEHLLRSSVRSHRSLRAEERAGQGEGGEGEGGEGEAPPPQGDVGVAALLEGEPKPNARIRFSAFNLANTIVGGGILALPFAMKLSGVALTLLLLVIIFLYGLFCLSILVETAEASGLKSRATFRDLARLSFGSVGATVSDLCMIISCFGLLCSYLVIIVDMLSPMLTEVASLTPLELRATVICISMLVLVPLSSLRHMNVLRFTSVAAIVAALYTVLAVTARSSQHIAQGGLRDCEGTQAGCVRWVILSPSILRTIPIVNLAFTCQMNFFTIYGELFNSNPRRMGKVSFRAMLVCLILFAVITIFGYLHFRDETLGNILLNYEPDDVVMIFARIAIAVEITFSYPILAHPCISTFDDLVFKGRAFTFRRRVLEAACFSVAAALIAIFVKDVSFIFSLTGSTTSNMISFVIPAAMYLRIVAHPPLFSKLVAISMVVLGLFFLVSSTAVTIIEADL